MDQTPKIGAFVLETLTTGMYTNPLDSIREFIQNSTDSILKGEEMGILGREEGRIIICINEEKRAIKILDNGVGVPESEIKSRLIDIGMSGKNIEKDAGFRGIGRLAGIAYCNKLIFRTKAKGEKVQTTIEFDCIGLKNAISPTMRQVGELADIIGKNYTITKHPSKPEDHFFEVEMVEVDEKSSKFLDWNDLEEYLSQVAPVNYDAQRFKYSLPIKDWANRHGVNIPTVNLVIKKSSSQERQIFRPFKNVYQTSKIAGGLDIHVQGIRYYPEENINECGFWIWYSDTPLMGMITDIKSAGLRFRKNNIQIGSAENVAALFAEIAESNKRFNAYFIGEVHILDKNVIPNARRDGFEDNDAFNNIKNQLKKFIQDRCEEIRKASEIRNMPTQKLVHKGNVLASKIDNAINVGIVSTNQRDNLLGDVDKYIKNARTILENRESEKDREKIQPIVARLEQLRNELTDSKNFVREKLRTDLDKKQRKIIDEIIKILEQTLDSENFKKAQSAIMEKYRANSAEK